MSTSPSDLATQKGRPLGVTILAVVAGFVGLIMILGGLWWLGVGFFWLFTPATPAGYALLYGIMWIILGIIAMIASAGLFRLEMWAWWLLLFVGILQMISLGITSNWILLGLWAVVVIYLIAVRKAFTSGPPRGYTA